MFKFRNLWSALVLIFFSYSNAIASDGGSILGHKTNETISEIKQSLENLGYEFREENITFKEDPSRIF